MVTRNDIVNATDEQLDIWCAVLMGWKVTPMSVGLPPNWSERRKGAKNASASDMRKTPSPTTDPAAAWELLEWFSRIESGEATTLTIMHGCVTAKAGGEDYESMTEDPKRNLVVAIVLWGFDTGRLKEVSA